MPPHRVMKQWQEFRAAAIPPDAPPDQIREMRRAFFGGAVAMLGMLGAIGESDVSEDAGVVTLQEAWEECEEFTAGMATGKF